MLQTVVSPPQSAPTKDVNLNKQDLLYAVYELRRVKCHKCSDIRREIDTMEVRLTAMDEKLSKVENVKLDVKTAEENVVAKLNWCNKNLTSRRKVIVGSEWTIQK